MIIMVPKKLRDPKPSDGSTNSELTPPYRIYDEKIDTSRVPRIFLPGGRFMEEGDGLYKYPGDDYELMRMLGKRINYNFRPGVPGAHVLHHVEVNADRCTVQECLKLLKKIGCKHQFVACSLRKARLFYADLTEDDADKLKGLDEIDRVYVASVTDTVTLV